MDQTHWQTYTLTFVMANVLGALMTLPVLALVIVPYGLIHGWTAVGAGWLILFDQPWLFLILIAASVVVHEGLHGIGWGLIGGAGWAAISFGVKALTPYAHCDVPLDTRSYRIGAALPGLVLGVAPAVVSWASGQGWMMAYAALMLAAASGDALVLWLIRDVDADRLVRDHPSEVGCEVSVEAAAG